MLGQRQLLLKRRKRLFIVMSFLLSVSVFADPVLWNNDYMLPELKYSSPSDFSKPATQKNNPKPDVKVSQEKGKSRGETEKIGIVADINDDTITIMDVLEICGRDESRLPYIYKGGELNKEVRKLRLKALNLLIDRKLIYQYFKEKGYKLPKDFVEYNLDKIMEVLNVNNRGELQEELKKQGSNITKFREKAYEDAAVDLLMNDMCFRNVYITPRQIYDYYIENKDQFSSPTRIRLQLLKIKDASLHREDLDAVLDHLKKSFKKKREQEYNDAVQLYSDGPNIEKNGDIGWVDKSKLRSDFKDLVKDAKVGDIIGPAKLPDSYYFLRVSDIKQKKTKSFKYVKEEIEKKLTNEQKEKDYNTFITKLREKAYIREYL